MRCHGVEAKMEGAERWSCSLDRVARLVLVLIATIGSVSLSYEVRFECPRDIQPERRERLHGGGRGQGSPSVCTSAARKMRRRLAESLTLRGEGPCFRVRDGSGAEGRREAAERL